MSGFHPIPTENLRNPVCFGKWPTRYRVMRDLKQKSGCCQPQILQVASHYKWGDLSSFEAVKTLLVDLFSFLFFLLIFKEIKSFFTFDALIVICYLNEVVKVQWKGLPCLCIYSRDKWLLVDTKKPFYKIVYICQSLSILFSVCFLWGESCSSYNEHYRLIRLSSSAL